MKRDHAVHSTYGSVVEFGVGAGRTRVDDDIADSDLQQRIRTQADLPAEQQGFVVAWELRDWSRAEEVGFAR